MMLCATFKVCDNLHKTSETSYTFFGVSQVGDIHGW